MSLDGTTYPVDQGPRPPAHHQCRSTTVPVVKSWKELGIDLKEAPPGTRASMNGQVPSKLTYPQWLKRQPAAIQREALGPTRAALFRSGRLTIDRFVDQRGRPLSLKQIRQREQLAAPSKSVQKARDIKRMKKAIEELETLPPDRRRFVEGRIATLRSDIARLDPDAVLPPAAQAPAPIRPTVRQAVRATTPPKSAAPHAATGRQVSRQDFVDSIDQIGDESAAQRLVSVFGQSPASMKTALSRQRWDLVDYVDPRKARGTFYNAIKGGPVGRISVKLGEGPSDIAHEIGHFVHRQNETIINRHFRKAWNKTYDALRGTSKRSNALREKLANARTALRDNNGRGAHFNDMINAMSDGAIGSGHSVEYYAIRPDGRLAESFADLWTIYSDSGRAWAKVRDLLPELATAFEKTVEALAGVKP
jgi:hypothetical protein